METTAFIFDLDGVIVDTAKYHYLAWKEIAGKFDYSFGEKENEKLKGISRKDSLDLILAWANAEISEEKKREYLEIKNEIYLGYIEHISEHELLPGFPNLLSYLNSKGIKKAVGSASKNAKTIIHKLNLWREFEVVVDGNDVSKSKPDPEVFEKGANAMNVPFRNCLVVEDSIAGIKAASQIDMKTIGVGNTKELGDATVVVESLTDLHPHLLQNIIHN